VTLLSDAISAGSAGSVHFVFGRDRSNLWDCQCSFRRAFGHQADDVEAKRREIIEAFERKSLFASRIEANDADGEALPND
jgi:hypothetical protein